MRERTCAESLVELTPDCLVGAVQGDRFKIESSIFLARGVSKVRLDGL